MPSTSCRSSGGALPPAASRWWASADGSERATPLASSLRPRAAPAPSVTDRPSSGHAGLAAAQPLGLERPAQGASRGPPRRRAHRAASARDRRRRSGSPGQDSTKLELVLVLQSWPAPISPTSAPTPTSRADAPTYDVVVVGFGIAGGCAALEAARAGARVLLLERAAVHGGTSTHVRRPLLPRRRDRGAAGDRPRGLGRGDGRSTSPRSRRSPSPTRSAPTARARSSTSTGSSRWASSSSAPTTRRRR